MPLTDLHVSGGISSSEDLVVLIHEALKHIVVNAGNHPPNWWVRGVVKKPTVFLLEAMCRG